MKELEAALAQFLPNWDQDRVYPSDVRKLFQWFNLLLKAGSFEAAATEETAAAKEVKAPKAETTKKKAPSAAPAAKAAKPAAPKKPTAVKTGSSRGK
jgi:hypothetical protein